MNNDEITLLVTKIVLSAFGSTGLLEYAKNFIKTEKTWIYSLLMPVFAVACYLVCEFLPAPAIGCILTVGAVQLDYQIIVQGFKKLFNKAIKKADGEN